ncbi:MAG: aminotransferase class I/II-fold pyridoxal phosphate-dependent enzyme [Veillonellaceae bacterium]|uniref:aminotransferase class I/II-fold pyridoxal phosphate-dependent enzyme n=1 Tax=Anaerovibrio lipolyticus TaxID=82374 RepID=UPI001F15A239|nr:aminotransferase class I/II-fold pyridoxal phosphate-dependent enzyme [Anaerovibrio lipolyticus]MCI6910272.1 aminotransferase class I/II-fold pyridoxal phosphate-dependent enzyme [Veillonellaceae bacterium]MDY4485990.1 aminotransferase class I/II-fold pyridoxal phosphate-dependent enzyme [Anaerovibrio sp.]MCF2600415.1 aminotransferase class I/II-fold pyridoxal phosphate-dependent enzyme [Anaerovibrio lipolyticus]MCI7078255.1 aminotransferase class I/II-fold pyridoxal phosphate-dependent enzy
MTENIDWQKRISPVVQAIPPSGIRRFFDIAAEMEDVISLGVGEPDFVTPWSIRESCVYGLEQGYTSYTANRGLWELREEICALQKRNFNIDYDPKTNVLVTVGVSEALDIAMRAILTPGDEILIPEPCYVSYKACASLAGAVAVAVPAKIENNFSITPADLEAHVTNKTKALLIGYPNNPTGAILTKEQLMDIAKFAQEHDLIVISDEIYGDLTYGGERHVCFAGLPGMKDRTILLNGFSKAYAMTGWRIGYAMSNPAIISAMTKIHQYTMLCAPITAQIAAVEALRHGEKYMKKMVSEYDKRRRLIYDGLTNAGLKCFEPKGAFYIFPDITSTGLTSEEFAEQLLMKEHVALVPGTAFGQCGEGYVRCSYATSVTKISEAIARIEHFVQHCKK